MATDEPTRTDGDAGFVRDGPTWLAYGGLSLFAYVLYLLGPVLALLRDDLHLDYVTTSLHSSAFALGLIAIGLGGRRALDRISRGLACWLGAAGMALGCSALALGTTPAETLPAALVVGLGGALLQAAVIAEVGASHGVQAPRAFSEANVLAMIAGVMAPAAIVLGRASGLGWRSALWLPAAVVVAVTLLRRRLPTLGTRGSGVDRAGSLPRAFWSWLWVVVGVAATEGSILIWSATLLHERASLGAGAAAGSLAVYYVAEFAARLAGSRVSGRLAPPLLVASLATALAGLLLLWEARSPLLAIGALALTGLGMANLYPLAVGLALTQAPGLANAASSRVSLAIGCASLTSPFALGALADVAGIGRAFGLTPALVLVTALTLTLALRARRPRAALP